MLGARAAVGGVLLGTLFAFFGWSLASALDARVTKTFGIPGDVTVFDVGGDTPKPTGVVPPELQLRNYLQSRSVPLVVHPSGDGYPGLTVLDPAHVIPWLSTATGGVPSEDPEPKPAAYLFRGSYSADLWARTSKTTLVPPTAAVVGVIPEPEGAGGLQFAVTLGRGQLPIGTYVLGTTDEGEISKVLGIVARSGLDAQQPENLAVFDYLRQQEVVVIVGLLALFGEGCFAVWWWMWLYGNVYEIGLRARHGASPAALTRQTLSHGIPAFFAGAAVGAGAAALLAVWVGSAEIGIARAGILITSTVAAILVTSIVWFALLSIWTRLRYEKCLAA